MPDVELAVERLSEDETLRGDLTDRGFAPLFAVATQLAVVRAPRFGSTDELYLAVRGLLKASVEAAQMNDPAALSPALISPLVDAGERAIMQADLASLPEAADEAAIAIATTLSKATNLNAEV